MDVEELWGVRVPDYTDKVLVRCHRYKHIIASRLWFVIGVEDLRVMITECAAAACENFV